MASEKRPYDGIDNNPPDKKPKEEYTRERAVDPSQVWIRSFIHPESERGSGVLKERYSDFVVREVTEEGEVSRLTTVDIPAEFRDESDADLPAKAADRIPLGIDALKSDFGIGDTTLDELKTSLGQQGGMATNDKKIQITSEPITDKQQRGNLHKTLKKYFPKLTSYTNNDGLIFVMRENNQRGKSKNNIFKKLQKDYVQFTMYKQNLETQQCISAMAAKLRINPKCFSIAGTKDKRGITVQQVTAYRVMPEELASMNDASFGHGSCKIGNYKPAASQMRLGMLQGNRFSIILRRFSCKDKASVDNVLNNTKDNGFINYFGPQRFGSTSVPTHTVAQHLLRGDIKSAVDVVFKSKAEIIKEFKPSAEIWSTDTAKALELCPRHCRSESACLQALLKDPSNYMLALDALPRNSRSLYFHALQSVIWNEMATVRASKGTIPLPGDLVVEKQAQSGSLATVKILSEADISSGMYKITDVVLPLPGIDEQLKFPTVDGVSRPDYVESLKAYDAQGLLPGSDPSFVNRSAGVNFKTLNLFGGYRPVVVVPQDLTWGLITYNSDTDDLQSCECQTETNTIYLPDSEQIVAGFGPPSGSYDQSKPLTALQLSFTLPSSCYATMFLREIAEITTTYK